MLQLNPDHKRSPFTINAVFCMPDDIIDRTGKAFRDESREVFETYSVKATVTSPPGREGVYANSGTAVLLLVSLDFARYFTSATPCQWLSCTTTTDNFCSIVPCGRPQNERYHSALTADGAR